MQSKIMVVTGGSRGLGAATALLASKHGYDLCINYNSNEERARQVAREVERNGRRAMIYRADMTDEAAIVAMFSAVDERLGTVSALVNSAGVNGTIGRVDQVTAPDIRRLLETNVLGTFLCCREAIRWMSTLHGGSGGNIVAFSSAAARLGAAGRNVHYAASKGAIESMTFGLAQEVARENIRVNAVSPGVIDTEMQDPARLADIAPKLPMGRAGLAEEVARAVLWLVSEESSYVSGTVLNVSGAR